MEPIEINAGTYYLRQFRADDRVDDRPALLTAFADPAIQRALPGRVVRTQEDATGYVDGCAAGWRDEDSFTWAIAEPTTGALIGEVRLALGSPGGSDAAPATAGSDAAPATAGSDADPATAELTVWTLPDVRRRGVAATAVGTVVRFGFGALGLTRVNAACAGDDAAAIALARRCGFSQDGDGDGDPGTLRWTTSP